MRSMNFLHRGFDESTNVLSFPAGDDLYLNDDMPEMEGGIGDVAISGEAVMREAAEAGIAAGDHLLHLFTHGVLHLLGYDHIDDQMADEMEALEIALLGQMNNANNIIKRVAVNRHAAVIGITHLLDNVIKTISKRNRDNISTRNHHISSGDIAKPQKILQ